MDKHKTNADTMTAWQTPAGQLPVDVANRRAEMESLRTFALTHNEIAFAHLVTASLNGEGWAIDRATTVLRIFRGGRPEIAALDAIRATDTTRPDGATPRGMVNP